MSAESRTLLFWLVVVLVGQVCAAWISGRDLEEPAQPLSQGILDLACMALTAIELSRKLILSCRHGRQKVSVSWSCLVAMGDKKLV